MHDRSRTGDRARVLALVGARRGRLSSCLRIRGVECRQVDALDPSLLRRADGVLVLRDPSAAEWQVLECLARDRPVFLDRLPDALPEAPPPIHFVPDVLFRPGLLALGTEIGRRCDELRWIEWEAAEEPDRWLHGELSILVHWFGDRFRTVSVDAMDGDRMEAHLAVEDGPTIAVDVNPRSGSSERNALRASFGGVSWTVRLDAVADQVTVGDGADANSSRFAAHGMERYLARYIADVLGGRARNFFAVPQAVATIELASRLRHAWRNRRQRLSRLGEVVLVKPPRYRAPDDVVMLPPLGLARLQAWLKAQGFEVRVVDLDVGMGHDGQERLAPFRDSERIERWLAGGLDAGLEAVVETLGGPVCDGSHPALVGFSVTDVFEGLQARLVRAVAQWLRTRLGQSVPIVVGGDLEAIALEVLLGEPRAVDFVVYGDGERALTELAQAACLGDRPAERITGVQTRSAGSPHERARVGPGERPLPDFSGVPFDSYRRGVSPALRSVLRGRGIEPPEETIFYLPYAFVDGCNGRCVFCSWGGRLGIQKPEKSVRELLELSERYETDCFYLLDTTVNVSRRTLEGLVEGILQSGRRLFWTDSARPYLVDDDLARGMAEAGCVMLSWGVESGSDAVLQRMGKGFTADEAAASLQAAHLAGILNRVNLIAGFLHETDDDIQATRAFLDANREAVDLIGCFQGFYLFEGMGLNTQQLGIRLRGERDTLHLGQGTVTYDEVGGLDWPRKKRQIERSHTTVKQHLGRLGIPTFDKIDDYDLFHIARIFGNKAARKAVLLEASAGGQRDP